VRLSPLALGVLAVIATLSACGGGSENGGASEAATFEEVQQIVERRCYACHSQNPTDEEYKAFDLPKFDNPDNITKYRDRIYEVVVVSKRMPQGNRTMMTQEERDRIASWETGG
jgi:uncharacterized membrane protein